MILLAICLIVAIAMAIAASMRTRSNQGSASEDYANATRILSQAENYAHTFNMMAADGVDLTLIKFYGTSPYSMINPSNGYLQIRPADAVQVTADNWNYRGATVFLEGAGSNIGAEYVLFLNDILFGPCQQINQLLYQSTAIPAPNVPNATLQDWYTTPYVNIDFTVDPNHATLNRPEGCIVAANQSTGYPHYIYYKALYVQ